MKYIILISLFSLFFLIPSNKCDNVLATISDEVLIEKIKNDEYLVVLFTKKNCIKCDEYEKNLLSLLDELQDSLEASVVKVYSSQLTRLYSPTKEPALVYFRHGLPLLYDGPINDDVILQTFYNNKSPVVKELSDENFEHLTQASTGATTGDWFIQFYTSNCVECQRLSALWEAVGASLSNRMNTARINSGIGGSVTAERFKITKAPEFILLRQGKFYRYSANLYDVPSFVSFAQEFYKNSKAERVPVPPSPFDELVSSTIYKIQPYIEIVSSFYQSEPNIVLGAIAGVVLSFFIMILVVKCKKTKTVQKEIKKKAK